MWTILLLIGLIYIVYSFCAAFGKTGSFVGGILVILILLGAGNAWLCTNIWWYGEKVVPPEIDIQLEGSNIEPLLGEQLIQDEDGNYSVVLTDHRLHVDDYDQTPDLTISITPENAILKKAHATLTVTKVAMQNPPSWLQINDPDIKDQTTVLDENFTFAIDGSNIRFNENPDLEPTQYRLIAKNNRGESSVMLTITRYPLYKACGKYNAEHPDRSAIDDISLCRERADYDRHDESSSNSNESSLMNSDSSPSNNSHNSGSANEPDSSGGTSCIHYEAGRCWDEIEEQAYDAGGLDRYYGGHSYYNPPDDCAGVCLDFYEDAYYEGYDDY